MKPNFNHEPTNSDSLILSLLQKLIGLLAPAQLNCPMCSKAFRPRAGANLSPVIPASLLVTLCTDCLASIPWITHIRCAICGRAVACRDCPRRSNASLVRNRSAVQYDAAMKELLALYKYRGKESLLPLLAEMMSPAYEALSAQVLGSRRTNSFKLITSAPKRIRGGYSNIQPWDIITFVPVSPDRLNERGFNQAERLASAIGEKYRIPVLPLLERVRNTAKQSLKNRAQRLQDTEGLFEKSREGREELGLLINDESTNKPVRILLIDDVYTTGGTLHDCARALAKERQDLLEVYTLTWARS